MTIETKITCDCCQQEIKYISDIAFTIKSIICEIKLEVHFCSMGCMRNYMETKWPLVGLKNEGSIR